MATLHSCVGGPLQESSETSGMLQESESRSAAVKAPSKSGVPDRFLHNDPRFGQLLIRASTTTSSKGSLHSDSQAQGKGAEIKFCGIRMFM